MLINKKMSLKDFCFYVVAQLLGDFIGAVALFGIAQWAALLLGGNACNMPVGYDNKWCHYWRYRWCYFLFKALHGEKKAA